MSYRMRGRGLGAYRRGLGQDCTGPQPMGSPPCNDACGGGWLAEMPMANFVNTPADGPHYYVCPSGVGATGPDKCPNYAAECARYQTTQALQPGALTTLPQIPFTPPVGAYDYNPALSSISATPLPIQATAVPSAPAVAAQVQPATPTTTAVQQAAPAPLSAAAGAAAPTVAVLPTVTAAPACGSLLRGLWNGSDPSSCMGPLTTNTWLILAAVAAGLWLWTRSSHG